MPYFARHGYLTYAMSLRGHGGSAGRYRGARFHDYLDDVRHVVREFEEAPILVGHSLGGYLVRHVIADAPTPAAVLVATMPPDGPPRSAFWRTARRHPMRLAHAMITKDMWPLVATPELCREQFFAGRLPEAEVRRLSRRMQGESLELQFDIVRHRPVVPAQIPPMLVLGAEHDAFSPATQRATARRYGAECMIVPGSGHDIMLDVAWREAADVVIGWLSTRVESA
jgi:pimeloyl-ACP methyl ester carboxylesterase